MPNDETFDKSSGRVLLRLLEFVLPHLKYAAAALAFMFVGMAADLALPQVAGQQINALPFAFHGRMNTGQLISRVTRDVDRARRFFSDAVFSTVEVGLYLTGISQRLRHADTILVLEQGRFVERGTHGGLMAHRGIYRDIHDEQFAGEVFA